MTKVDGRKLSHEALESIRIHAVNLVVKGKKSPEKVVEALGFGRPIIYTWLKKYAQGGIKALLGKKAQGPERKITEIERKKLKKLLIKNPRQLHFDFGLWTLWMVQELIKREFGKRVCYQTISNMLHEMGFSVQKPQYRASEQDEKKVEEWKKKTYPALKREAKKEGRVVFWQDEAGFRSEHHSGTTWGEKGKRPVVKATGHRHSCNGISAITSKGEINFMLYHGKFNAKLFISFLKRLLEGREKPVTILVDGHPVHKAKAVTAFVASTEGKLKMYFLPPYSPELNPDEQVWQATKHVVKRKMAKTFAEFKGDIRSALHSLQKQPSKIASFFHHPDVVYVTG
jgi:transposase